MGAFNFFSDLITPTKYDVPEAPQLDITGEQLANVQANAASFAGAKDLAAQYNDFMASQVAKQIRQSMPEFEGLQSQVSKNLAAQLRGEISTSDLAASQRSSAARSLGLGLGGSPAGAAMTARDLGLTQLGIQQQAQAQTPAWMQSIVGMKRAPMFDFSSVFLTPAQRLNLSWQNKASAWNVQNLKNQLEAQPEPWMRAMAGLGDPLGDFFGSAAGSAWMKSAAANTQTGYSGAVAEGANAGSGEGAVSGGGMSY